MSSKPGSVPTWATDSTYSTIGPYNGLPNKVAYSSGRRAEGDLPATPIAAENLNSDRNLIGQWLQYLSDGALSGDHTIAGDLAVTGALTVDGALYHGDVEINIPGSSLAPGANVDFNSGTAQSTGAAVLNFPIPLKTGDRIKSLTLARFGDGSVDLTIDVKKRVPAGTEASINASGSVVVTNAASSWIDEPIPLTATKLVSGDELRLQVQANAAGAALACIRVVFDRPPP